LNTQDFIVRAAASLTGRFGIAFGAERLALDLSQQTATEKAKAHAQLKFGYFNFSRTACAWAFRSSSETSTGRVASTSHFSTAARELDAAIPARFINRWVRAHRQLRDQPRPVRPLPAARGLARAGPPAQSRGPLEPRTAKHRGAPTGIRASNAQAFRVSAKCADLRTTPPPEATAPAIRHDSTRKASR
jgi:hypothetical protein